ncbi:MAG TPA: XRE family transcriptional regulator [Nitrospira sp.]|nr:XRE family transcriptional regulator [Nitrospira sp.]
MISFAEMGDADGELGPRLAAARERAGFSQDEVGLILGQPRPVVSNWESGTRVPASHQLSKLSKIYRVDLEVLLGQTEEARPNLELLLFRDAHDHLNAQAKYQVQRFLRLLDDFGDLLEDLHEPPGLTHSPLQVHPGFQTKEDIRRKAEEAREFLRIGREAPVGDLAGILDVVGISLVIAPLGRDLKGSVSGAFVPHHRVGFAMLINSETTPGRRRYTIAHELAHALFHGDRPYVGYPHRIEAAERFADLFAAEFLVPAAALRSVVERLGFERITDAEAVVHLQRYFDVSYATMLSRLRAVGLLRDEDRERLRDVQPVYVAKQLGYQIADDEWGLGQSVWGIEALPRRLIRLARRAVKEDLMSISSAAEITGLAEDDIEELVVDRPSEPTQTAELEVLGVSAG